MTISLVVIFLAAFALVGYALANAWRHVLHDSEPPPLYGMLQQEGLTLLEARDAIGAEALAFAARRCAFCSSGAQCRRRLAAGAPPPANCPNSGLFAALTRPRA